MLSLEPPSPYTFEDELKLLEENADLEGYQIKDAPEECSIHRDKDTGQLYIEIPTGSGIECLQITTKIGNNLKVKVNNVDMVPTRGVEIPPGILNEQAIYYSTTPEQLNNLL